MSCVLAPEPTSTMPRTAARACPVCRSREAVSLWTQRYCLFDDSDLPRVTDIVRCSACATAYASSDVGADAYRAHYARHSKYDTAPAASGSGEAPEDGERLGETAAFLARHWERTARIVDVGAGRGGLLAEMRRLGFARLEGIDPSAGCVEAMRARGLVATQGLLEDGQWETRHDRFDAAILSHVLEHVHDVDTAFARVASRLADDARIYVEVPDASRYDARSFPPFYFFDPEHINHFDARALATLAARHEWTIVASHVRWLRLAGGGRYPAVGAMLRRGTAPLEMRSDASDALERYIDASRRRLASDPAVRTIAALAVRREPIVVWGAGSHAQRLFAQTALRDAVVDVIIDGDPGKQGRHLDGHRIVTADEGLARVAASRATIVMAIAVDPAPAIALARSRVPGVEIVLP